MKKKLLNLKKALLLTELCLAGASVVGCNNKENDTVIVQEEKVIPEEHGNYGLGDINTISVRKNSNYVGFYRDIYDVLGYPTTGIIRYEDINDLSVIKANKGDFIVKNYSEVNPINTYYDYLRDNAVPNDITINSIESFDLYLKNNQDLFDSSLVDQYSNFNIYNVANLLGEQPYTLNDLILKTGEKYIQISRSFSTLNNAAVVKHVPVDNLSIVSKDSICFLIEDYVSGSRQCDLLRGEEIVLGDDWEVDSFYDYVLEYCDIFSEDLVNFLNSPELSDVYCMKANEFTKTFEKSIVEVKEKVKVKE